MSDLKIFTNNIEQKALDQINTLIAQPAFADCKIRIMPDVHAGKGCVIGFTADLGDKVIPDIVGVDIGCGMLTAELGNINIDFKQLDETIRENIPSGRNVRDEILEFVPISDLYCKDKLKNIDWLKRSLGTLGGGNHFIEVDVDEYNNKYLVIHSGSRNLGKQVAEIYQQIAFEDIFNNHNFVKDKRKELIAEYKKTGRQKEIEKALKQLDYRYEIVNMPPKELCYLEGEHRELYLHDMKICQEFAKLNRKFMKSYICFIMGWENDESKMFDTIHNYIDHDTNIVRKGAISARKGERLLIPINMRDGCIIGVGKGNDDWNCSAPHGAGRVMSRYEAREKVSMQEYEKSMQGIYTTSVNQSTIDESPMAYKPIDEIIENIGDTVEIERIIKPIYNFKASE